MLSRIIGLCEKKDRVLVAIAGPPGAGKSTISEEIRDLLTAKGIAAKVVPMDGFHLDNAVLDRMGMQHRKGAPETFDAEGFVSLVKRLSVTDGTIKIPVFDRAQDKVIEEADEVLTTHKVILIEGNYLLLDEEPWKALPSLFDLSIFVNPGMAILEERLVQRWLDHDHTPEEARERALSNDIPNARRITGGSHPADIHLNGEA